MNEHDVLDGACAGDCYVNWWGPTCSSSCPRGCYYGCDRVSGNCLRCLLGLTGPRCDQKYDRESGPAYLCADSNYGRHCDKNCSDNCKYNCNSRTGECNNVCSDRNRFGRECELVGLAGQRCVGEEHMTGVNRVDGSCDHCADGYYGELCDKTCPGSARCGMFDGTPVSTCPDAQYKTGNHCNSWFTQPDCSGDCLVNMTTVSSCHVNYYGPACEFNCSTACAMYNDENKRCHRNNGVCTGCAEGKGGRMCELQCVPNCQTCSRFDGQCLVCKTGYYGDNCEHTMPHGHCQSYGDYDTFTGRCRPCIDGYFGDFCEKQCIQNCNRCNQVTGECLECAFGYNGVDCRSCPPECPDSCVRLDMRCPCNKP